MSRAAPPPKGRNATVASNGPIGADTRPSSRIPSQAPARTTASRAAQRPTPRETVRRAAERPADAAVLGSLTRANLAPANRGAARTERGMPSGGRGRPRAEQPAQGDEAHEADETGHRDDERHLGDDAGVGGERVEDTERGTAEEQADERDPAGLDLG